MSTSTTCPGCPGGCGLSRGSTPRITLQATRRTARCATELGAFFADHDLAPPEGRITALLQARVFGYVFNPLSVFWCHDRDGRLLHVIAEVHNTYGQRHAYLLPPADLPVMTAKKFYVSPFFQVDGYTWCKRHDPTARSISLWRCTATNGRRPRNSPPICADNGVRQPSSQSLSCKSFRRWLR